MRPSITSRGALAGLALAVLTAGCGGAGAGGSGGEGEPALGVELVYAGEATPRAAGLARTLAAADASQPAPPVADPSSQTWLRVIVEGPDFAPVVCEFPKAQGGRCRGIPAGTGRSVTVEEWDAGFESLHFRGRADGVRIDPGRDTRVAVRMRPPVTIRHPDPDAALNRRTVDVVVQAEPAATVQLFVGRHPLGLTVADANGIAAFRVDSAGPGAPLPDDGASGLADGPYLLAAAAFPKPAPGRPPVRHLAPPLAFEVDLKPPALALSGPSVTGDATVELDGLAEPGSTIVCAGGEPAVRFDAVAPSDGRFRVAAVGLGPRLTTVTCTATDRAGNATVRVHTVAHRPDGFAIQTTLPAITNQPRVTLEVRTDPGVDGLLVELRGDQDATPLVTPVRHNGGEPGVFAVPLDLRRNQWNHVTVKAQLGGITLGEAIARLEHDDVPPAAPVQTWWITDPPGPPHVFEAGTAYLRRSTWGFKPLEEGAQLHLFKFDTLEPSIFFVTTAEELVLRGKLVLVVDGNQGYLDVPSGYCSMEFPVAARDRAGNYSKLTVFWVWPLEYYCIR
ncbi:MAG TPA: hypothetical protein VNM66_00830 [Thermodesulfobacteriota bacterium]|nr:hypothetical protein [Thermodesulfobacteriota bacterium]